MILVVMEKYETTHGLPPYIRYKSHFSAMAFLGWPKFATWCCKAPMAIPKKEEGNSTPISITMERHQSYSDFGIDNNTM